MGWYESNEEKKLDTRLIERNRQLGGSDPEAVKAAESSLPDSADACESVNLANLFRTDNPKHFARGIPTNAISEPRNIEEEGFEDSALGGAQFEH